MKKITSFSGGETSGFMLRLLLDQNPNYRNEFETIFCNTGREHEKTLDFVHEVETRWNVPVTWLEYRRILAADINPNQVPAGRKRANLLKAVEAGLDAHWFTVVDYKTASRRCDFGPFDMMLKWVAALPNVQGRSCSAFLKMRTNAKYLHSKQTGTWQDNIGIRFDERHRATEILSNSDEKCRDPQFPLIEGRFTKEHVEAFWSTQSFRLDIPNYEGNCDGCFLKSNWKRLLFAKHDPQNAQWWADKEAEFIAKGVTDSGAQWKGGKSFQALIDRAQGLPDKITVPVAALPSSQSHPELDFTEQDIPCSCAVGGYRGTEDDDL